MLNPHEQASVNAGLLRTVIEASIPGIALVNGTPAPYENLSGIHLSVVDHAMGEGLFELFADLNMPNVTLVKVSPANEYGSV